MARPKKTKNDRYSEELRIKVRPALKALVQQAAANEFLDESSFLRSLIERNVRSRSPIGV